MATQKPIVLTGTTHTPLADTDKLDSTSLALNPSLDNILTSQTSTGLLAALHTSPSVGVPFGVSIDSGEKAQQHPL